MASSRDPQPHPPESQRPRLSRVPHAGAIRLHVSADDPALPDTIGGSIAAEPHGDQWMLTIEGPLGTKLLHIQPDAPFHTVITGIRAALASVSIGHTSYPVPDIAESCEVTTRQSRGFGS